jgi:hypothetical protein
VKADKAFGDTQETIHAGLAPGRLMMARANVTGQALLPRCVNTRPTVQTRL